MTGIWLVLFVVQWALLLVLLLLVFGLLRYFSGIERRLEESIAKTTRFERGDQIPDFDVPLMVGGRATLATLTASGTRRVLLLLISAGCSSCEGIVRQVAELSERAEIGNWTLALACHGSREVVSTFVEHVLAESTARLTRSVAVLVDEPGTFVREFMASAVPVGIALDERGRVLDQSSRPGPNWIYLRLGVPGPAAGLLRPSWIGEVATPLDRLPHEHSHAHRT